MSAVADRAVAPGEDPSLRRWLFAAAVVVLAHAGLVYWLLHRAAQAPAGEPPAAMMIELAPMAVSPREETAVELTPGPQMTEAEPEEEVEPVETQVVPELPPAPKAVAVLAPPPKPQPKPVKKVVKKVHKEEAKPPAPRTSAPVHTQAAPGQASAAPRQGASGSRASFASWHSQVGAHIARHVHYPESARPQIGTPALSFTLDRGGRVLSARVVKSSGSAALDQEAVAAAHRASPFPAAPAEMGGGAFHFTVPIRFHLR